MPTRTPWDHARAALLLFHLVAITIAAIPVPVGELTEARHRDPDVRRDLGPWTGLIQGAGLASSEDEAMDWLWHQGHRLESVYGVVSAPGQLYLAPTGNRQSWRMFSRPRSTFGRLEVLGRTADGPWTRLHLERSDTEFDPWLMDHARARSIRTAFAYGRYRKDYRRFATWLGRRVLDDEPELVEVRVQLRRVTVPPPHAARGQLVDRGPSGPPVQVHR